MTVPQRRRSASFRMLQLSPSETPSWVLAALCLQVFVSISFKGMAPIALPDMQRRLPADLEQLQWVLNSYSLALAAISVAGGSLSDVFGRRRLFLLGLALFFGGSAACALCTNATALDFASGVFGLGAGISFAPGVALVSASFSDRRRNWAFGVIGAVVGSAGACSSLIGGALVRDWGWRSIFCFCSLFAAVAFCAALNHGRRVSEPKAPARRFDWLGLSAFSAAIFAANFGLIRGNALGFGSPTILGAFAGAVLAACLFVITEAYLAREIGRREPLVPALVLNISNVGAAVAGMASSFVAFGLTFYMALYIANVLSSNSVQTGLRLLPLTAVGLIFAPLSGRFMGTVSIRNLLGGALALVCVGCLLLHGISAASGWGRLVPGLLLVGAGSGAVTPPMIATVTGVVAPSRAGVSAGLNNTARQVGTALGVGVLGAVLESHIAARLVPMTGGKTDVIAAAIAGGDLRTTPPGISPPAHHIFSEIESQAFFSGINDLFLVMAAVAGAAALACLLLVRERDFMIRTSETSRGASA